jgi:hypothetical protein
MKTREFVGSAYERIFPYAASGIFLLGRMGTDVAGRGPIPDELAIENGLHRLKTLAYTALAVGTAYVGLDTLASNESKAKSYVDQISACASVITGQEVDLDYNQNHIAVPAPVYEEVEACRSAGGDVELARTFLDNQLTDV